MAAPGALGEKDEDRGNARTSLLRERLESESSRLVSCRRAAYCALRAGSRGVCAHITARAVNTAAPTSVVTFNCR